MCCIPKYILHSTNRIKKEHFFILSFYNAILKKYLNQSQFVTQNRYRKKVSFPLFISVSLRVWKLILNRIHVWKCRLIETVKHFNLQKTSTKHHRFELPQNSPHWSTQKPIYYSKYHTRRDQNDFLIKANITNTRNILTITWKFHHSFSESKSWW